MTKGSGHKIADFLWKIQKYKYATNLAMFAKDVGIHRNQLERYVSGDASPSVETLEKIAAKLDTTPAKILATPEELERLEAKDPPVPEISARLARIEQALNIKTGSHPEVARLENAILRMRNIQDRHELAALLDVIERVVPDPAAKKKLG